MTVRNSERLIKKLRQLPVSMRSGIGQALAVSVVEMDSYAKSKISGGGRSGRVYGRHQASAPGEFPKSETGQLVSSLLFRVGGDKLSAFFGTKLAYGRYLEFGTSRMAARPWLQPTLRANARQITARVRAAVNAALRQARG